jgi:hypothetical protein
VEEAIEEGIVCVALVEPAERERRQARIECQTAVVIVPHAYSSVGPLVARRTTDHPLRETGKLDASPERRARSRRGLFVSR